MSTPGISISTPRGGRNAGGITEVAALAWPAVLQTLSDTVMQAVDAALVGRLGMTQLGAIGFGGIWYWTLVCVFAGTASGVQTFVAQASGAGRNRECGTWPWQAAWALALPLVVWLAVVAPAIGPFLGLLGASPGLQTDAVAYFHARLWGAPGGIAAAILGGYFRGLGDTRTPLAAAVIANLVNVVVAWALIFGRLGLPAWGVAGAGVAMALAVWINAGILFVAFRRLDAAHHATASWRPERHAMRRFVVTSAPIGGQWVLDMASFAVFTTVVARMGDRSMAASQAMLQLLSLSFMQAIGISIAAGALVGRYVGAGDLEAAERSHASALKLGAALATVVALLFVCVPDTLLRVFTAEPDVLEMGRGLLAVGALYQLCDAAGIVAAGSLRGAGDTRWPFVLQAALAWLLRLPLVWLCAVVLEGGVIGAWLGELGYVCVLGAALLLRFRAGAWRRLRI